MEGCVKWEEDASPRRACVLLPRHASHCGSGAAFSWQLPPFHRSTHHAALQSASQPHASRAAGCVHLLRADLNVSARLSQKRCAGCRTRPPTGTKNMAKATSATHAINQGPS